MSLVACKECGNLVSTKAVACPKCGAKPPRNSPNLVTLVGLLAAIIFVVSVYTKATTPEPTPLQAAASAADKKRADLASTADKRRVALAVDVAATVKSRVRDPDSLRFSYLGVNESATIACGRYQARNGFGGMNQETIVVVDRKPRPDQVAEWVSNCNSLRDYTSAAAIVQ